MASSSSLPLQSLSGGGGGTEGLCPHGCGGRYSGRPLQICQVTPVVVVMNDNNDDNNNDDDASTKNNTAEESDTPRWARASPPKFRRLISSAYTSLGNTAPPTATASASASNGNKNKQSSSSCGAFEKEEDELERRRATTRFVYLENVFGNGLSLNDIDIIQFGDYNGNNGNGGDGNDTNVEVWKHNLISILQGKIGGNSSISSSGNSSSASTRMDNIHQDIDDDVRHAFQEGLRRSLAIFDTSSKQHGQQQGVELFLKVDTTIGSKKQNNSKGKQNTAGDSISNTNNNNYNNGSEKSASSSSVGLYEHLHIGMRSNDDATELIKSWQGKRMPLTLELPKSFLSQCNQEGTTTTQSAETNSSSSTASTATTTTTTVTIMTGKLFLDYADILLPKGRSKSGVPRTSKSQSSNDPSVNNPQNTKNTANRGEASRSECTSTTSHVHIPGLHVLPNYVSEEEEQIILAVLTGPHAPWAPPQYTPSGGMIRRRVQHYGYVFDYESADVLRRDAKDDDDVDENGNDRSACPPLPAIDPKSCRGSVADMSNDDVEGVIAKAVEDVHGWEALAGIIQRTRKYDFSSYAEEDALAVDKNNADSALVAPFENVTLDKSKGENSKGDQSLSSQAPVQFSYPNINQLTVNEYQPGQGIGSHVDTETAFDDGLLIITLNGGIVMEFRKVPDSPTEDPSNEKDARKLVYLPPRSLVLLSRDARYKWEHMIVSRTTDTVDGKVIPRKIRVSLTLRTALTAPKAGEAPLPLPLFESRLFPPRWGQLPETAVTNSSPGMDASAHSSATDRSDLITPATESKHVHAVYDAIATQWHHTRGKRGVLWPAATEFLSNLPPGSIVADVGCGDGKYFSAIVGSDSYVIGTDISLPLLRTAAAGRGGEEGGPQSQQLSEDKHALSARPAVAVADCIHLPLRTGSCDAAICIAVMHHLSTVGRRIRCLAELARVVKVGGMINVQAWALEQENDSKRKFHGTDVLVPFNAQPKYLQASAKKEEENGKQSKAVPGAKGKGVAEMLSEAYDGAEFDSKKNLVIFQRYCHMYRQGELEELVSQVQGLELLQSAYEKGNHVVLARVREHNIP